MKTVELFSGTKSFSKVACELGHQTFTVDNEISLNPDLCIDILNLEPVALPIEADILWASPPCTTFSVASISHYWIEGKPKNDKARHGIRILDKTIQTISETKPKWWFIENPRGMMRKVIDEIFKKYNIVPIRHTVTYCQYGATIQKPTDIWTNATWWHPKPKCSPGASCHERAGRGAKTGLQGIYNPKWEKGRGNTATERGRIPAALFKEILNDYPKD